MKQIPVWYDATPELSVCARAPGGTCQQKLKGARRVRVGKKSISPCSIWIRSGIVALTNRGSFEEMKAWCVRRRYDILFVLLIFCIACHGISKSYGFYFPADEFGYWFHAARLAGYDWSDIASLGSYYSYGYSLVLLPVFLLFQDGIIAYRAALFVNFAMLAVCFFVLQKMVKNLSPFHVAVAVFYPTWLFYAGTTFAEVLLVTLYIVICLLLLNYLRTDKKQYLVLLFAAMLYMYFVHMRAIGVMASGVIVLLAYGLKNGGKKVKYTLLLMIGMGVIFAAGLFIKKYWTGMVYSEADSALKNANDYAGQVEKIAYIFSKEGFKNLVISVAGKFLYLGLASFGIAYFGIIYAVKMMLKKNYFSLFVVLSTLAAVMISAIYTIHPGRVDALTYGRYHEYVMPVLMILGIKALSEKEISALKAACGIVGMFALEAVLTWLVTVSLRENGQTSFFGNTICGISWLYDPENFEPVRFYWRAYAVCAVLTVIACMGIWWTSRQKGREILLTLLVAVQIVIGIRLSSMYVDASRLGCFRDTFIVQKIEELNTENDREVYYSTDGEPFGNIGILQFMMRDTQIHIIKD
ncbi:MAG: hypothetical protein K2I96_22680, partial [Lachnospiraceae bacterium]|nr:hypothetical protein [Lachnospiraceae bacterium]